MHIGTACRHLRFFPSSLGRSVNPRCRCYVQRTLGRSRQTAGNKAPCAPQTRRDYERPAFRNGDSLKRKSVRLHQPPQGRHRNASTGLQITSHASVISPKAAGTQPATASSVTRTGALCRMATRHRSTNILTSTVHRSPMPLFTSQLLQGSPQFPSTSLPRFIGHPVSPHPYQHTSSQGHPTSATALPSQPHFPSFYNPYHPLQCPFTSVGSHAYAHTAPRSAFCTLGPVFLGLELVHKLMPSFAEVVD